MDHIFKKALSLIYWPNVYDIDIIVGKNAYYIKVIQIENNRKHSQITHRFINLSDANAMVSELYNKHVATW